MKGKGANLRMPALGGLTLPMRVQLQGRDGACWETVSSAAQVDDATRFTARSD